MLMNEIEIVNLADDLKFLPEVSEWIWKERQILLKKSLVFTDIM